MRHRPTHEEIMEIGELGSEIYERDIEHQLTMDDDGVLIVIDVDSGEWQIGPDAHELIDSKNRDARTLTLVHIDGPRLPFAGTFRHHAGIDASST